LFQEVRADGTGIYMGKLVADLDEGLTPIKKGWDGFMPSHQV